MRYTVSGTSRQVGAIGVMEPFTVTVDAHNEDNAREAVRETLYAQDREHVLCKSVSLARPVVIVIECPQEDPWVFTIGDVELIDTSSYPSSSWCSSEEVLDYVEGDYRDELVRIHDILEAAGNEVACIQVKQIIDNFDAKVAEAKESA